MNAFVLATCELLVAHFRNLEMPEALGYGFHSRVFSHLLHPEERFVFAGQSQLSTTGVETRLEHLVPCRVLHQETIRLIHEGALSDAEIARLLASSWRVARIAHSEQQFLDRSYKQCMPDGWRIEQGDVMARLKLCNIELQPPA